MIKGKNKMVGLLGVIFCFVLCSYLPSCSRATETLDLESEKTALRSKIFATFELSNQQKIRVNNLIGQTFADIVNSAGNCPDRAVETSSTQADKSPQTYQRCGPQRQCVARAQCNMPANNLHISEDQKLQSCASDKICCEIREPVFDKEICGFRREVTPSRPIQEGAKRETDLAEFPWMIAVLEQQEFIGAGVLIAKDKVLTSASKVNQKNPQQISVRAGEWNQENRLEMYPHQDRLVKNIIQHEEFENNAKYNNIALLQLSLPFSEVPHIKPICLSDSFVDINQANCLVTAWGSQKSTLHSFILSAMSTRECENRLRQQNILWFGRFIRENILCTEVQQDIEACGLDDGSPLVCSFQNNPKQYSLVGLVSCGWSSSQLSHKQLPGIYANVTHFEPWIRNKLRDSNRVKNDNKCLT